MRTIIVIVLFLCGQNVISITYADTVLAFETNDSRLPNNIVIKGDDIRISFYNQPLVMQFNRAAKRLTFLQKNNKTYFQVDEKNFKRIAKAIQKLSLPAQHSARLTDTQQASLEKAFAKEGLAFNRKAQLYRYQNISSSVYKGIDCDVVTVFIDETPHSNHCLATARYIGINSIDFKTYLFMLAFLQRSALAVPILDPLLQQGFTAMPIVSQINNGKIFRKFSNVTTHNVDKNLFAIPKDFKQVANINQL